MDLDMKRETHSCTHNLHRKFIISSEISKHIFPYLKMLQDMQLDYCHVHPYIVQKIEMQTFEKRQRKDNSL